MSTTSLPPLSAAVTRILSLTGFPATVKTRDVQVAFSDYESANGGFKIKWVDDHSLLLVFNDPIVAKRAYLSTVLLPPPSLSPEGTSSSLQIKPYDGPDAQAVIYTVNNRRNNPNRASVSVPNNGGHGRTQSYATNGRGGGGHGNPRNAGSGLAASMHAPPDLLSVDEDAADASRRQGGSPTLPNLETQPTLESMLSSSLSDLNAADVDADEPNTPDEATAGSSPVAEKSAPRVGDAGRRMVGHALGVKHPGIASATRRSPPEEQGAAAEALNKAMDDLTVAGAE